MFAARLSRISSSFSRYNPWISRSILRHVKIHSAASQNPSLAFQHKLQGQRSKQIYSRILKSPHDIHETTSIHGLHPVRHWGFDPWLSSRASIHGLHPGLHPWPLYLWLPAMASIHGPMRGFHPWDSSMASIDPFHVFIAMTWFTLRHLSQAPTYVISWTQHLSTLPSMVCIPALQVVSVGSS